MTQIITNKKKTHLFYKIIHFSVQFSAVVNRFILKTLLNSTFTNDLKRKLKKNRKMFIVADLVSLKINDTYKISDVCILHTSFIFCVFSQ